MKNPAEKLLLAGVIAVLLVWWWQHRAAKVPPAAPPVVVTPAKKMIEPPAASPLAPLVAGIMPILVQTNMDLTNHLSGLTNALPPSDPMDDKIKLGELWASTNPATVNLILPYLTNADAEVRAVAIEAIKQVGDRSTVPLLEKMAAETTNAEQSAALTQAALFLIIPTLTERDKDKPLRGGHAPNPAPNPPPRHQPKTPAR